MIEPDVAISELTAIQTDSIVNENRLRVPTIAAEAERRTRQSQPYAGLILLLTLDPMVEKTVGEALVETGGIICLARTADDAIRIACSHGSELELAVIDFEHGANGMTLMGAIKTCANHYLPILVLLPVREERAKSVARANGAAECVAKPFSGALVAKAMINCKQSGDLPDHSLNDIKTLI